MGPRARFPRWLGAWRIYDAVGVRMRRLPMRAELVLGEILTRRA